MYIREDKTMACFLVPTTEAIITTAVKKAADVSADKTHKEIKNPFIKRMNWLNNMLWGGSALLALEHVWHGEIVPWAPFLTAAEQGPAAIAEMLGEMAVTGVAMAAIVTAAWAAMVVVTNIAKKHAENALTEGGNA